MNLLTKPFAAAFLLAALAGCSDSKGPETPARIATALQVTGVHTTAQPGEALTVQATVLDQHGAGLPNSALAFTPATNSGTVSFATATSDAQGRVVVIWTLSQQPGPQQLRITTGTLEQTVTTNVPVIEPPTFSVFPKLWQLPPCTAMQCRALEAEAAGAPIRWFVNDVEGGNAQVGRISASGVYTAPNTLQTVTIHAFAMGATAPPVTVTTTNVPGTPSLAWTEWTPRAVDASASDSIVLLLKVNGYVPSVRIARGASAPVQMITVAPQTFRYALSRSSALIGYIDGTLHNFIGFLELTGTTNRYNLFANVRDEGVPAYPVTPLAADAQRTDYVLNLRYDGTEAGTKLDAVRRLYQLTADNFDFINVIDGVDGFANRYFEVVRNNVTGIGLAIIDNGGRLGSAARLQGLITYPMSGLFDGASVGFNHEIGHRWINFSDHPLLSVAVPHWPVSDLARDIMGFNIPGSNVGGQFPFDVVTDNAGVYRLACSGNTNVFSDLSLYMMGLVPPSEVKTHYVINNFTQGMPCNAQLDVTPITIDQIVAANGPRTPAAGQAQRDFRAATIVLSRDRLLSAAELAFFSHMAQRAELRTQVVVTEGFSSYIGNPWYLATGGRSTMTTKMW